MQKALFAYQMPEKERLWLQHQKEEAFPKIQKSSIVSSINIQAKIIPIFQEKIQLF